MPPPPVESRGEEKPILPPLIICFWNFFKNINKGGTLWNFYGLSLQIALDAPLPLNLKKSKNKILNQDTFSCLIFSNSKTSTFLRLNAFRNNRKSQSIDWNQSSMWFGGKTLLVGWVFTHFPADGAVLHHTSRTHGRLLCVGEIKNKRNVKALVVNR